MKLLFRILVTMAMFVLILRAVDLRLAWKTLAQTEPSLLVITLFLQFSSVNLAAYRWCLVMQNLGLNRPFPFYWRSYFKGMFFNQGLPTSIGGDALRILDVSGQGFRKRDALYGVMLDRTIGLAALLLLNAFAHALRPELLPKPAYYAINLIAFCGLLGFSCALLPSYLRWFDSRPWLMTIKNASHQLHRALCAHRPLLLILSLLVHLLTLLSLYAIGWALGLEYGLLVYLVLVPPAILFTLIPISLAGWGMREGAMIALFSLIDANKIKVLTLSILFGLLLILVSLPGLIVYLRGQRARDQGHEIG